MSPEVYPETKVGRPPTVRDRRQAIVYLSAAALSAASAFIVFFAWSRVSKFEHMIGVTSVLPLSVILYVLALRLVRPTCEVARATPSNAVL